MDTCDSTILHKFASILTKMIKPRRGYVPKSQTWLGINTNSIDDYVKFVKECEEHVYGIESLMIYIIQRIQLIVYKTNKHNG
jgi:hypothetical protein